MKDKKAVQDNQVDEELMDMDVVQDSLVVLEVQKMKDMMAGLDNQVVVEKKREEQVGVVVQDN